MTFDEWWDSLEIPDNDMAEFQKRAARKGWDAAMREAVTICRETNKDRSDFSLLVRGKMIANTTRFEG